MQTAWFITKYDEDVTAKPMPRRWCQMDTYTTQIYREGGQWEEIEVGSNHAIVKVKAEQATLTLIEQEFTRLPVSELHQSLASVTNAQRDKILMHLSEMGYSDQEVQNTLGSNVKARTLGDVLRFMATRRVPPRFDTATKTIVFDQPHVPCSNDVEKVHGRIQ